MLAALMLWLPAEAQLPRGARTIVRGGMFVKPDSLRHKSDSLANNALARELDSLMALDFTADSLAVTALRTSSCSAASVPAAAKDSSAATGAASREGRNQVFMPSIVANPV